MVTYNYPVISMSPYAPVAKKQDIVAKVVSLSLVLFHFNIFPGFIGVDWLASGLGMRWAVDFLVEWHWTTNLFGYPSR